MCGIAGIVDFVRPPSREVIARMTRCLAHRGPDDEGIYVRGPAALGHRRLSIIDLSPGGHQPMVSRDERFALTYNGELYNFRELGGALETTFASSSDTEVLLTLLAREGERALPRLNGMFAFGLWDAREERLLLSRDRFGQKPLYYSVSSSRLVFGSEPKAVLEAGEVDREIDAAALHEYCWFGSSLGERTLFRGVRKLPAGSALVFDRSGARVTPYFRIEEVVESRDDVEAATTRVRELLERAVERHLIADVPVGVFLSGGIDSSAVTALAARHVSKLRTYSVGFDFDPGELPKARALAERFGTEHEELRVSAQDLPNVLEALVRAHDLPFGDAANLPLYLLARALGGRVRVALQGDGGDEIFAGYRRYNVLAFEKLWRAVSGLARLPGPGRVRQRLARFLRAAGERDSGKRMALLLTEETEAAAPDRLLAPDLRRAVALHDPFARYRELSSRLARLPPVQRMLHTDASILLPDVFLEKIDRPTMQFGLEVRAPFLDTELTDYALGVPWGYKVRRLEKKWILRRALRGIVPDAVLDGPKRGFGVPYGAWIRGPLREWARGVLLDSRSVIDTDAATIALEEHASGARNHGLLLYKMVGLALWRGAYG